MIKAYWQQIIIIKSSAIATITKMPPATAPTTTPIISAGEAEVGSAVHVGKWKTIKV